VGFGVSMLSAVGGTGLQLIANEQDTRAKEEEAQQNARLAQRAAVDALERGAREAGQSRIDTSKLIAAQKVAYANSGVDPTVGTAANVQADTRAMGELDAKTLQNNAVREAWGYRTYGIKYQTQAQLAATRGTNQAVGTVLGGLGRFTEPVGPALPLAEPPDVLLPKPKEQPLL
jgi:hypothetical protein